MAPNRAIGEYQTVDLIQSCKSNTTDGNVNAIGARFRKFPNIRQCWIRGGNDCLLGTFHNYRIIFHPRGLCLVSDDDKLLRRSIGLGLQNSTAYQNIGFRNYTIYNTIPVIEHVIWDTPY